MTSPIIKRFSEADVRRAPKSLLETVQLGDGAASRMRMDPGWRWSQDIKPFAGSELCEVRHTIFAIGGHMRVRMESGEEYDVRAGDVAVIPPRHDAWVVGDEPFITIDFSDVARRISIPAEPAYRGGGLEERPTVH